MSELRYGGRVPVSRENLRGLISASIPREAPADSRDALLLVAEEAGTVAAGVTVGHEPVEGDRFAGAAPVCPGRAAGVMAGQWGRDFANNFDALCQRRGLRPRGTWVALEVTDA